MYSSRNTSQSSAQTFDDEFSKLSTRRSCPLKMAFLLFFIWLASSAAFGSLIAIWKTSSGEFDSVENDEFGLTPSDLAGDITQRATVTQYHDWWSGLVASE
jgi:hypothetical protein